MTSPRITIALFALVVLAMAFGGAASVLNVAFPVAALGIGIWLFARYPGAYMEFALLVAIFAPEVRRLVDFSTGWHDFSPVMLAQILVPGLAVFTPLGYVRALSHRVCAPFVLCIAATLYAFVVGLFGGEFWGAAFEFASWIVPIIFGLHCAIQLLRGEDRWSSLEKALLVGTCLAAIYGLVQYFALPAWDAFWMANADISTVGIASATEFRIFGPMNSQGPFSIYCMAALLVVCSRGGLLKFVAGIPILVALLLTLVRSSWLGFVVGLAVLLLHASVKQRARLIAIVILVPVLALPIMLTPVVSDTVGSRLMTLTNVQNDESYQDRRAFYDHFVSAALENAVGAGFGATGLATKFAHNGRLGALGNFDSGVLEILFVLGWPGAVCFVFGLAWLLMTAFLPPSRAAEQARSAAAVAIAIAAQLIGSNTIIGVQGLLFWAAVGVTAAASWAPAPRPAGETTSRSSPPPLRA
jgi:O-Antigen ligase